MKVRVEAAAPEVDPTAWLIDSSLADILLLSTVYIKYMAMFCYCYVHGSQLFPSLPATASLPYKFVSMIFKCTGGGTIVPLLINAIPVSLAVDAYPIAIMAALLLHEYAPILREVMNLSPILKVAMNVMFEIMRASVVVKLTSAAAAAIAPSDFSLAVFGPIMCGSIAGCGGAFLPFSKGLDPIKEGLTQPMISSAMAAAFYHLFVNTSMSEGVKDAAKKAHVLVAIFFIAYNLSTTFPPKMKLKKP